MKITLKKTHEMMDTAERHYINEQRKSGLRSPIPYAFVKNEDTGALMIYTPIGHVADKIMELLKAEPEFFN